LAESIETRANRELDAGRIDAAIAAVRLHLKIKPRDLPAMNLLGELLQTAGQVEQAVQQLERVVALAPSEPSYRYNLGNALLDARRGKDAVAVFERLIREDPNCLSAYVALAIAYVEIDATDKAIAAGRRAVEIEPALPAAAGNLLFALVRAGESEEAVKAGLRCLQLVPNEFKLRSMTLFAMNYLGQDPDEVAEAHREYGRRVGAPANPAFTDPDPERPIRVGLLSGELRDHSVAFFLEPILRHPDPRVAFEAFATSGPPQHDATTERIRERCAAWHDCGSMPHDVIDALIRRRGIDVMIDLGAHSGEPRLLALASKPAPVIMTAIGYPNTTGMPAVDWRVVDSITDPPGSERLCTERLLRIEPCFLCYTPPTEAPEPELPVAGAPITFGSFNAACKIGPESIALWTRVLQAVPGSRLLLKSQTLSDATGRRRLEERFGHAGIDPARLELVAYSKTRAEHLALYGRVHVALDTVPYNGTTTTCEALWMGVPVVTMLGDRHAARVSASLLHSCGHPELVATDAGAFVELAGKLAVDRARLSALRARLRTELRASPLCDAPAYAARFHAAVRDCWKLRCAKIGR
jgi:predicted O-linked N-acetylglucosamine transferase (SPINDLY family)